MTTPNAQNTSTYRPVRAPRGAALSCKGWPQEAALRMLLNCLDAEVAERPQDLFISGAAGRAAADWDSVQSIVASLRSLDTGESLRIESGRPAEISRSSPDAPRVVASNARGGEDFGNWLYAGTQTALPVLYEIYGAAARQHFGGTLAGKLIVGGGMGGAGGAQPLAAALHGAAFLGIDADAERIKRRLKSGYCDVMVNNLDEALRMLKNAVRQRKSASVGLLANCADLFPELAKRGVVPDVLTDCTPVQAPFGGYIPVAHQSAQESVAAQLQGVRDVEKLGTRFIESPTASEYLQQLLAEGWRLTTWLALSGEPGDIARLDRLALEMFPAEERVQRWLTIAGKYVRFQGLPARVAWLKRQGLGKFAAAINDLTARGELSAPIVLGWHDMARQPNENSACWTWSGSAQGMPSSLRPVAAQACVLDGAAEAAERFSRWPGA